MIQDTLKSLGFGDKEIAVYLAVLQHGKITPGALARIAGINRTTCYSVINELVEKGVVAQDLGSTNMYVVARPPADLQHVVTKQEKLLQKKKASLPDAIQELQALAKNVKYSVPKIVFVAEDELENHLHKQSPIWDDSMLQYDGIWWGFQDHAFVGAYEKWIDWYWEECAKPGISLRLLSNESAEKIKKKKFAQRDIRFWDQSHNFQATTWILGDYVVMIVADARPHYLVEIHDQVLAHNLREVFKGIWNTMDLKPKQKNSWTAIV
ncbi:MAG: hypothetical protein A2751_02545 [Candidatus Doudnabacteria bacterium RIFCSPHIGHO2_01_FULL_46_14]|uniref:Transcription regulator TrmB N-terminal domain-containing protein n=1 Tax=Candidatus Doudnabacteria bacterium RIFCSPHIGHO2_01_FULL_46_14 TaxID=1817824 RepID=A0A1F5NKH0_9BACT|nr:MAG: hypothetical protein A2751_02545 [Candidatus Doudnabacteria bacterium RIFCSPHIGHO2_01_FULL_46_14]